MKKTAIYRVFCIFIFLSVIVSQAAYTNPDEELSHERKLVRIITIKSQRQPGDRVQKISSDIFFQPTITHETNAHTDDKNDVIAETTIKTYKKRKIMFRIKNNSEKHTLSVRVLDKKDKQIKLFKDVPPKTCIESEILDISYEQYNLTLELEAGIFDNMSRSICIIDGATRKTRATVEVYEITSGK